MALLSHIRRISIAISVVGAMPPAVLALTQTGGAWIGDDARVMLYDASNPGRPVLTRQTEVLTQAGAFVFAHDSLFVAAGAEIRRYVRRDLSQPANGTWSGSAPVLALADATERGLVLVLDATALRLVRFSDVGAPATLWSFPVGAGQVVANPGRLLVRDGNRAFVADASIPGLRLVSIDPETPPTTIAIYSSPDGAIHDLALWGRRLTLATESGIAVLNVSAGDAPTIERVGALATDRVPTRVDANSKYALVADGQNLTVVDVDPSSPGFLAGSVDDWQAGGDVRSVRLDKGTRGYVLVDGAYEILDLAAFGGR